MSEKEEKIKLLSFLKDSFQEWKRVNDRMMNLLDNVEEELKKLEE